MERIPLDIIINHIIPYTYNIQPKLLLEDIENYCKVKTELETTTKYNTNIIKYKLLTNCYMNAQMFNSILDRHFQIHYKKYDNHILYRYSPNTRFNIIFGLLSSDERISFLEYIQRTITIYFDY